MTNLSDNPTAYLHEKTGISWEDREGMLSPSEPLDKATTKKISSLLSDIGITPSITKSGASHVVTVSRESIKSDGSKASIEVVKTASPEMQAEYNELKKRNPKFSSDAFDRSIPNRFGDAGCRCVAATQLTYPHIAHITDEDGIESVEEMNIPFRVHANHVNLEEADLHVICSQAPTKESEAAFWQAAMATSAMILDLTNSSDRETKGVQRYFPQKVNTSFEKDDVTVTCLNETKALEGVKKLKSHTYLVQRDGKDDTPITRVHFRGWPDYGAVSCKDLSSIVNYVRNNSQALGNKPLWIHCRAGVGRSGAVTVALALANMHEKGKLTQDNYHEVINKLILRGREQRDLYFVQDPVQYQLVHDFAKGLLDGSIPLK
ncbi:MAG: dual specificity protein phosphatase family protein [Verrucomicrobia bacterium]|nr:dual specificity protein phosphatase family protein [Verrucomicrobiota bacterium]